LEKLNFEIEQTDIIDENPDSQFATAKVRVFSSGESRNDTYCSEEVLQATAHTIDNKPIVYNVDNIFGDFGSHIDPEKTLIAGFTVPGSQEFERLPDNRLSLSVLVKLWKRYAPKAMDIFRRDGGRKKVSVEVDLLDGEENTDGIKDMKNFVYSAICVLGDFVTEASPGAQLEMMSFAEENKKYNEAVALEFGHYEDIDFIIPENVKKNVNKGLELYKQYNKGATSVSLASARFISKNEKSTPEKVRHIAKIHKSNKFQNKIKSPPNESYISYMLYGGQDGMNWANEINNKLDEQDSKQLSYFSEELTFPYKNIEDANPALKGIDPPISASQANEIAKQADAIGQSDKVNGWAVAISSFKKTHVVQDGKWVKKEKNMEEEKMEQKEEMAVEPPKEEMAAPPAEEPKKESPEEEKKEQEKEGENKKESPEEEKKEEEKEKEEMSLDQNLDVAATLAMLANETDAYSNLVKEEYAKEEKDFAKMFDAMCSKMCKMAEENKNLLAYKKGIEEKQFEFAVQSTMKDIEERSTMPQDKKDYLFEESKKFSLENVDAWRNLAKAEAFSFAIKGEEEETEELHFANPWGIKDSNKKSSLWDD
jgi:hypothetical protein